MNFIDDDGCTFQRKDIDKDLCEKERFELRLKEIMVELRFNQLGLIGAAIFLILCMLRTVFFGIIYMTRFRNGHQSSVDKFITTIVLIEHPTRGAK